MHGGGVASHQGFGHGQRGGGGLQVDLASEQLHSRVVRLDGLGTVGLGRSAIDHHRHVALGCGHEDFIHHSLGEMLSRLGGAEAEGQVSPRHVGLCVAKLKVAPRVRAVGS